MKQYLLRGRQPEQWVTLPLSLGIPLEYAKYLLQIPQFIPHGPMSSGVNFSLFANN
jgi:hypothetical protein